MWKFLAESVVGTSHLRTGAPCQDRAFGMLTRPDGEDLLVLACADGAGSAAQSQYGAELASRGFVELACQAFQDGLAMGVVDAAQVRAWYQEIHGRLADEARRRGLPLRELACTLLTAVVGASAAVFAQVGDGTIVILDRGVYAPVFWPQTGEYANTTSFITDPHHGAAFECLERPGRIDELALLTDGLQRLVLNFAARRVHQPFFTPMFAALRSAEAADEFIAPLRTFLQSPAVNERTDDDKTLILATRLGPHGTDLATI